MAYKDKPDIDKSLVDEPVVVVRRLRVNRAYIGYQSNEQAILPGLYYEDDPFLFGMAAWLVKEGYAEWYV